MALNIQAEAAPLRNTPNGTIYIADTRVPLETVIAAFHQGDSPEQIVDSYDVLKLADVYAVIAYYLNHREEVEKYIQEGEAEAERVRREIESQRPDMFSLRARLLVQKAAKRQG